MMTPQVPQQSKEQVAYNMVYYAIGEKWITITTYDEYLKAVAKAIYALGGTPPKALKKLVDFTD